MEQRIIKLERENVMLRSVRAAVSAADHGLRLPLVLATSDCYFHVLFTGHQEHADSHAWWWRRPRGIIWKHASQQLRDDAAVSASVWHVSASLHGILSSGPDVEAASCASLGCQALLTRSQRAAHPTRLLAAGR